MAITAVQIEASGWVLRVTASGTLGSFASYVLDPDGSPKVALTCVHPGFAPSGGVAVATPLTRTLVATKALRKPANFSGGALQPFVVDETDNGDGTVTVRLVLSDHVHATETSVTASFAAGWRSGESAATPAVVNNSTFVAAQPIFRWADVPQQRATGAFTLELIAFSHHPQGLAPLAGVKFTVTDGTTVKTVWATALSTSTRYGDSVRVYAASVDPAVATALTAGLLRCDAEVYPWLGGMRSTDPAGTRSMTGLATASYATPAQTPFVVAYDPAGTRYGIGFVVLDPVNGTTTAAAAMVAATLAAAKAVAAAAKPRDVLTAIQAGYLANRTLAAANGQAGQVRSVDGLRVVIPAGRSVFGSTAVTYFPTNDETWTEFVGDPDDANPRANCILQGPTAPATTRLIRMKYANLSLEMDVAAPSINTFYIWTDNVELRAVAGKEATSVLISSNTGANFHTRTRAWKAGKGLNYQLANRPFLIRACETSRRMEALTILSSTWLGNAIDSFAPAAGSASDSNATGGWGAQSTGSGDLGSQEDVIIAGNDLRSITLRAWKPAVLAAATAGTPNKSYRRLVFANNLVERIAAGNTPEPLWSMGEDESATMSYNIVEGNTFLGDRCNLFYADPLPATVGETNTQVNQAFGNRVANNSFDAAFTKHDAFNDTTTAAVRGNANGYRPQLIEAWSVTYGVGFEGNYDWGRSPVSNNFLFDGFGLRGVQTLNGVPNWPADRSKYGSPATGGGTYKPPAASPLIGRALRASVDRDRGGAVRTVPFASGAVDTPSAAPVMLVPAKATSASRSNSPQVRWFGALVPVKGRSVSRSSSPLVRWSGALTPAKARSVLRNLSPLVRWSGALVPAKARSVSRSASPLVKWSGTLVPAKARSPSRSASPLLQWSVALVPAKARSVSRSTLPLVRWSGALVPVKARSQSRSASPLLRWLGSLTPAKARSAMRAASPVLAWSAVLLPAKARSSSRSASPVLTLSLAGVMLSPTRARSVLRDRGVAVLPDLLFTTARTLRVMGDLRVVLVPEA